MMRNTLPILAAVLVIIGVLAGVVLVSGNSGAYTPGSTPSHYPSPCNTRVCPR